MGDNGMRYDGRRYRLAFPDDRPYVYLLDAMGRRLAELCVAAAVHPMNGRDDVSWLGSWERRAEGEETVFVLPMAGAVWRHKEVRLCCRPDDLRFEITVEGKGDLAEVTYFGGNCSARPRWGSGHFASGHAFRRGFNPEPNDLGSFDFSPLSDTNVDMTGAPLPGRRHWFFNPAPFLLAFEAGDGWLGFGVEAAPGANRFTELRYHGGEDFYLTLPFDGQTRIDGRYDLPAIGILFGDDPYEVLAAQCDGLRARGLAPSPTENRPEWWSRPIFCGWGAQCAEAGRVHGTGSAERILPSLRYAPEYARQDLYEHWLGHLDEHGVHPGTVVIDDKWQQVYGSGEYDRARWPDLPGFIAARHARGQHVLLWFKAWDPEGVPPEECIRNAHGLPLAVDPTHPSYERTLRRLVRSLLGPDGLDADGFKIDFTHRIPTGPNLQIHGDCWGLELMKCLLGIIHDEAHRVKPDALIMTHTPHPYLADVVDMIRLNDLLDLTHLNDPAAPVSLTPVLRGRARVAAIACPHALIDTDNWPVRDRAAWREYVRTQPEVGVPSLYFADRIDLTGEPLDESDYHLIREAWSCTMPIG